MSKAKTFFTLEQQEALKQAIVEAEKNTSGEIRIHIDNSCNGEALQMAEGVFTKLSMHKTKLRNSVLIYLAVVDKKFAILGDSGIHSVVPDNFWDTIKEQMQAKFKEGKFTEGLCESVSAAGVQLKKYFPYKADDVNELNNEVSFGK